jgi:retron-type reverse transcriptase
MREDWTYHTTYSGVPQGSIVSPVLANVYLHELDGFMNDVIHQFVRAKARRRNEAYAEARARDETSEKER